MKEWRKSWCSLNIHGKNGNGVNSKRKLLPDERSLWDDYLDLARLSPVKGEVCISAGIGYSREQLSQILRVPRDMIERANRHMQELGMITVSNNGVVIINNWAMYQPDYERVKVYKDGKYTMEDTEEDTREYTPKGTSPKEKKRKEKNSSRRSIKYIRKEYKEIYPKILNHWNEKKVIVHKYLTDGCYGTINTNLDKGYNLEELLIAINNYAYILHDHRYFWSYKWTLHEFLRRGLEKFKDLATAKQNYRNRDRSDVADDVDELKERSKYESY